MTFEEEFDLSIPDDDVLHVRTVGDINESLTPLVQGLVTPTD
jgi:acyl carrier protein